MMIPWIPLLRAVGMMAGSAMIGTWIASPDSGARPDSDKTGFAGFWARLPLVAKVTGWVAVAGLGVAVYNYFKKGNWKGGQTR